MVNDIMSIKEGNNLTVDSIIEFFDRYNADINLLAKKSEVIKIFNDYQEYLPGMDLSKDETRVKKFKEYQRFFNLKNKYREQKNNLIDLYRKEFTWLEKNLFKRKEFERYKAEASQIGNELTYISRKLNSLGYVYIDEPEGYKEYDSYMKLPQEIQEKLEYYFYERDINRSAPGINHYMENLNESIQNDSKKISKINDIYHS